MKGAQPSLLGTLLKLGIREAGDGKGMAGSDSVKEENQNNLLVDDKGTAGPDYVKEESQTNLLVDGNGIAGPDFLKEESQTMCGIRNWKCMKLKFGIRKACDCKGMAGSDSVKEESETNLLIATIIATVTFTAAFTVPGGYQSQGVDEGLLLFGKSATFGAFLITNTLAFGLSMTSILVHFFASLCDRDAACHESVARRSSFCIFYAIMAMLVAFISGTYTVVPHYLGITVAVILSLFFIVNMIYHICVFKSTILRILGLECIHARKQPRKCISARECNL